MNCRLYYFVSSLRSLPTKICKPLPKSATLPERSLEKLRTYIKTSLHNKIEDWFPAKNVPRLFEWAKESFNRL